MELSIERHDDSGKSLLRLDLQGRLNTDTAPALSAVLHEATESDRQMVLLNMAELTYISSAGLRVIFKAAKTLKAAGRSLAVSNRQPQVEKVFEILQALPDMAVFANEGELDAYLDAMQKKVTRDD